MPTTPRGAPYPGDGPGAPNDVPGDLRKLAEWSDAHPGCTPMSAAARGALPAPELWEGRLVYETDTGRLLVRVAGSWRRVSVEPTLGGEWQSTSLTFTGPATHHTSSSINSCRVRRTGNTVQLRATVSLTVTQVGYLLFNLPAIGDSAVPTNPLVGTAMWPDHVSDFTYGVTLASNKLRLPAPQATSGPTRLMLTADYEIAA